MSELAEGARLEIACAAIKWHRGFESLSLRHSISSAVRHTSIAGCACLLIPWGPRLVIQKPDQDARDPYYFFSTPGLFESNTRIACF